MRLNIIAQRVELDQMKALSHPFSNPTSQPAATYTLTLIYRIVGCENKLAMTSVNQALVTFQS